MQGCDVSILLDDGPSIISEKNALPNKGSVRGYEVIEAAKSEVEKLCPGVVSCADVIVAARDASEMVGGPSWSVKLRRRDSTSASLLLAESGALPSFKALLDSLISTFGQGRTHIGATGVPGPQSF
ncbi:putative peroxidase [Helianthus debilis subsp. tardiflorus]